MGILFLLVFMVISPLLMLIGILFLGRHLLKRKIKPNEEYLEEIKEVKENKRLNFINSIIMVTMIIIQNFNKNINLLLIPILIIEVIRNKYILNYLKTKNENDSTRKYILHDLYFQAITLIVGLGLYFLYCKYIINRISI